MCELSNYILWDKANKKPVEKLTVTYTADDIVTLYNNKKYLGYECCYVQIKYLPNSIKRLYTNKNTLNEYLVLEGEKIEVTHDTLNSRFVLIYDQSKNGYECYFNGVCFSYEFNNKKVLSIVHQDNTILFKCKECSYKLLLDDKYRAILELVNNNNEVINEIHNFSCA